MNKNELFKEVANKTPELNTKQVESVLTAYANVAIETLESNNEEKIVLPGLGSFKVKDVPERKGVSVLGDRKEWVKPAHKEICFKISKNVKELS